MFGYAGICYLIRLITRNVINRFLNDKITYNMLFSFEILYLGNL